MKKLILLFVVSLPFAASAQKFFVEKSDEGYENPLVDKLMKEKKQIVFKQDSSQFTLKPIVTKTGMGMAKGSLIIVRNSNGEIVARSKEVKGNSSAFNGYRNPKVRVIEIIADKYLNSMIEKLN